MLLQSDWTPGTEKRRRLFEMVVQKLNNYVGKCEFVAQDGVTGPLIRHVPTNVMIGLRPSMPANPAKPFDLRTRLQYRFPVRADGSFNVSLLIARVRGE